MILLYCIPLVLHILQCDTKAIILLSIIIFVQCLQYITGIFIVNILISRHTFFAKPLPPPSSSTPSMRTDRNCHVCQCCDPFSLRFSFRLRLHRRHRTAPCPNRNTSQKSCPKTPQTSSRPPSTSVRVVALCRCPPRPARRSCDRIPVEM